MALEVFFWILVGIIFYSYLGYTIILFILSPLTRQKKIPSDPSALPEITLLIAAYNEKDYIEDKIANCESLNYPRDKVHILFVTDGSDDGSPEMLSQKEHLTHLHEALRNGKSGAINRGMKYVKTSIVIFSDCNTMLSSNSARAIVDAFNKPKTGCVAGEKRITNREKDIAVNAGEGLYWQYESLIKKLESDVYMTIGAAGEIFAIRTELFEEIPPDTILDDFMISLQIAQKGYRIHYEPQAYGVETASVSIREEIKRKTRIAAGSIQTLIRLKALLNPFRYGMLSLQYISHKVLRWTIIPFSLPVLLVLNLFLFLHSSNPLYAWLLCFQLGFYVLALLGRVIENCKTGLKFMFIPYYFLVMNVSVYLGIVSFLQKKHSHNWERVQRGK